MRGILGRRWNLCGGRLGRPGADGFPLDGGVQREAVEQLAAEAGPLGDVAQLRKGDSGLGERDGDEGGLRGVGGDAQKMNDALHAVGLAVFAKKRAPEREVDPALLPRVAIPLQPRLESLAALGPDPRFAGAGEHDLRDRRTPSSAEEGAAAPTVIPDSKRAAST